MQKRTIWERLQALPTRKRTEIRYTIAMQRHISPDAVLKHLQKYAWEEIGLGYQAALIAATRIDDIELWEDDSRSLVLSELTMRYQLVCVCVDKLVGGDF